LASSTLNSVFKSTSKKDCKLDASAPAGDIDNVAVVILGESREDRNDCLRSSVGNWGDETGWGELAAVTVSSGGLVIVASGGLLCLELDAVADFCPQIGSKCLI